MLVSKLPSGRKIRKNKKNTIPEKKRHTYKELLISTKKRKIVYVSAGYRGKEHDYSLLPREFPPTSAWFEGLKVRLDLGFQGFADLYTCEHLPIPYKRRRTKKQMSNELTAQQKSITNKAAKSALLSNMPLAA